MLVGSRGGCERAGSRGDRVGSASSVVSPVERGRGGRRRGAKLADRAHALTSGEQLVVLRPVERELVDLAKFVLQQLELAVTLGAELAELLGMAPRIAQAAVRGGASVEARLLRRRR